MELKTPLWREAGAQPWYNPKIMRTYNLDLVFLETPEGELPGPPIAHVYVKTYSTASYKGYEKAPLITPQCVSISELEHHIEQLQAELETIRSAARRKFEWAQKCEQERFEKKSKRSEIGKKRETTFRPQHP